MSGQGRRRIMNGNHGVRRALRVTRSPGKGRRLPRIEADHEGRSPIVGLRVRRWSMLWVMEHATVALSAFSAAAQAAHWLAQYVGS